MLLYVIFVCKFKYARILAGTIRAYMHAWRGGYTWHGVQLLCHYEGFVSSIIWCFLAVTCSSTNKCFFNKTLFKEWKTSIAANDREKWAGWLWCFYYRDLRRPIELSVEWFTWRIHMPVRVKWVCLSLHLCILRYVYSILCTHSSWCERSWSCASSHFRLLILV